MKTREQERAQAVHSKIRALSDKKWKDDYGRRCLQLPILIRQCGLCQALTFYEAKGATKDEKASKSSPEYHQLLNDLASVMKLATDKDGLSQLARTAGVTEYQRLTREAIACAVWFKRYAETVLKIQSTDVPTE